MKFQIRTKPIGSPDPTKISDPEEVEARNPEELLKTYKTLGMDCCILSGDGVPEYTPEENSANQNNLIAPIGGGLAHPPSLEENKKPFYFKKFGMKFKMENDKLYIEDYIKLEESDYRVISNKTGKPVNSDLYSVEVKDWVETDNENDDEEVKNEEESEKTETKTKSKETKAKEEK